MSTDHHEPDATVPTGLAAPNDLGSNVPATEGPATEGPATEGPATAGPAADASAADHLRLTLESADPKDLIIDDNVRKATKLDPANVKSIKEHGVLMPVRARRDERGRLVVRMGQMRVLAAIEAGLSEVPVVVEPDDGLTGDAATIERMFEQFTENDHRTPLSAPDEVHAVQQMISMGVPAGTIVRRRHMPRGRVRQALRVADSSTACEHLEACTLDLAQAAVVADFDDDPQAVAKLTEAAAKNPAQFDHVAQRLRDERELRRLRALLLETLEAQKVRVLPGSVRYSGTVHELTRLRADPSSERGIGMTPEEHSSCPGHAAYLEETYHYSGQRHKERVEIVYVCAEARTHGHAPLYGEFSTAGSGGATTSSGGGWTEEQRAERRTVIANNKDWESATAVRREWLTAFLARRSAPKDAAAWIATVLAAGSHEVRKAMEEPQPLAAKLLGLAPTESDFGSLRRQLTELTTTASSSRATVLAAGILLTAFEEGTSRNAWRSPASEQRAYFQRLRDWGYALAPVEALAAGDTPADTPTSQDETGTDDASPSDVSSTAGASQDESSMEEIDQNTHDEQSDDQTDQQTDDQQTDDQQTDQQEAA